MSLFFWFGFEEEPGFGVDNLLMESGDHYLLETGAADVYLLE